MNKRIFVLVLAALTLVGAVTGGLTFALFTASTPAAQNDWVAGTLAIESNRDQGDWIPGPMFYIGGAEGIHPTGFWAPGDTHHRVLQVENTGSLDAWLKHMRASLTSGSRDLADQLQVQVTTDPAGTNLVATGTLGQFIDGDQAFAGGSIAAAVGDVIDLHFWVTLPLATGNAYQGLSTEVSFSVYAEQMAHNP